MEALLFILICGGVVYAAYKVRWKLAYEDEKIDLQIELALAEAAGDEDAIEAAHEKRLALDLDGPTILRKYVRT